MKKVVILSVLYAVIFVAGISLFTSCSKDEDEPEITSIVGKWKSSFDSNEYHIEVEYTFNADGTYSGYSVVRGKGFISTSAQPSGNYVRESGVLTLYEKQCSFHAYNAQGIDFGQMDAFTDINVYSYKYSTQIKDSKLYIYLLQVPLILEGNNLINFIVASKAEFTYQRQ